MRARKGFVMTAKNLNNDSNNDSINNSKKDLNNNSNNNLNKNLNKNSAVDYSNKHERAEELSKIAGHPLYT